MRRYLFFALLLCLQWTAWGQATYDYRYWFDTDDGNQRTGSFAADSWHIDADLSGLDCSLHAIHIQVKDTAGVWSAPVTRHFIKMTAGSVTGAYYWFNDDFARRQPLVSVSGRFDIDVSALPESMHYFHYQANDGAGTVSAPQTAFFLKMPDMKTMKYRYWMDNDQSTMQGGDFTGGPMMIDVSEAADGFHIIYFQMEGVSGASVPANRMFIKIPQTENIGEMTCVCTIDGKLYKQEKVPSSGGLVDWTLDVSTLFQGLHRIQVQVLTPSGAASNVYDSFFFRTTMQNELKDMTLVYSVDGEAYQSQSGDFNTGMFHFDVDVASLEDGLHRLTYMLTSETGTTTKVSTAFFVKTPLGGPGIASYKYWLNDYEDEARFVKLAERKNPYELISLLPVDECPIRSTCFQFEVEEDGTPMVYAKNDIHLQFFDVSNRMAEAHKQYVDYNVGEAIEEITQLESGKRVYKAKPQDNKIYWFKVEAERGDSLTFKTDLAASIDVFNAKGDTLYHASGPDAVKFDGCRVDETATYYVALHDATAKNGTTIALDYVKIDKYAVLKTTPTRFGVPSIVNMSLYGNGFSDSTRIAICRDDVVIWADQTQSESYSDMSAYFEFDEVLYGAYDLRVIYTDADSLVLENYIHIEEADSTTNISIALEGNPFFLAGASATYELKITNHSNMPVYSLPFTLSFECEGNVDNIPYIKFEQEFGKEHKERLRKTLMLDMDKEDVDEIIRFYYGEDNDLTMFYIHEDTVTGKEYLVGNFVQPYVGANSTVNIPFTIKKVNHNIRIYASTKKHWNISSFVAQNEPAPILMTRSGTGESCCVMEALDCVFTLAETATPILVDDFARECVFGYIKETSAGIFSDILCNGEQPDFSKFPKAPAPILQEIGTSILQCAIDNIRENIGEIGEKAAEELIKKYSKDLAKKVSGKLLKTYSIAKDCVYTPIKSWVKGCGDDDDDDTDADPINSYDPNDIYGYRAKSGSKAIKKDWTDVYYTIEFENDTAFATASAQDVYLTDTLDSRYFDLKSFAPTSLKIGDKKVELSGEPNFVTTVDMRPKINAIAQVECQYDEQRGIAKWHFTSLDPMTMEHVTVPMDGFLPVNNSEGDGQGEVSFSVRLKTGLADGEQIPNRASIVFDLNEAIMTPTWINVVDTIAPQSAVVETAMKNDTIMTISFDGTDNYSGVWKYDLYVQAGVGASWFKLAENLTDSLYDYRVYDGIDYGFCVIATDSAGNVEQKELVREGVVIDYVMGDVNGDDRISIVDITMVTNAILKKEDEGFNAKAADLNADGRVSIVDATMITNLILKK